MTKRIEIIVRNPGLEQTENALGAYTLDFDDEAAFSKALGYLENRLTSHNVGIHSIIIQNEAGETRGFNPAFYVGHHAGNAAEWEVPPWLLPAEGASPPARED